MLLNDISFFENPESGLGAVTRAQYGGKEDHDSSTSLPMPWPQISTTQQRPMSKCSFSDDDIYISTNLKWPSHIVQWNSLISFPNQFQFFHRFVSIHYFRPTSMHHEMASTWENPNQPSACAKHCSIRVPVQWKMYMDHNVLESDFGALAKKVLWTPLSYTLAQHTNPSFQICTISNLLTLQPISKCTISNQLTPQPTSKCTIPLPEEIWLCQPALKQCLQSPPASLRRRKIERLSASSPRQLKMSTIIDKFLGPAGASASSAKRQRKT